MMETPLSKSYRRGESLRWPSERRQEFRCRHCRSFVGVLPSGGRHRNHCPVCLYSRHVDARRPGDRAADCGGSMAPVGVYERRDGEQVLVHRCWECGIERSNRIAADDDPSLVMRLALLPGRRSVEQAAPDEWTA